MDVDMDVLYGDCWEGEEEVVGGNVPLAFCLAGDVIVRPDKEERPSFVDRPPWRPPRFREPTLSLTTPRFSVSIGGIGDHGLRSSSLRNDDDRVSSRSAFARRILEGRFGSRKEKGELEYLIAYYVYRGRKLRSLSFIAKRVCCPVCFSVSIPFSPSLQRTLVHAPSSVWRRAQTHLLTQRR